MTHARVYIFPVRAAASVSGCPRAAAGGRVDPSGSGTEDCPGPAPPAGSSSRAAVGAAVGAAGGDGRRGVLGGDRPVGRDRPAGTGRGRRVRGGRGGPPGGGRGR